MDTDTDLSQGHWQVTKAPQSNFCGDECVCNVDIPESFLVYRIKVFNGFCVFTETSPSQHVHVFALN